MRRTITSIFIMVVGGGGIMNEYGEAHPYSTCPNVQDHLHVSKIDFKPESPVAGKDFTLSVSFNPDRNVNGAMAEVVAKAYGVHLFTQELNICEYVTCPVKANDAKDLTLSYPLPSIVPSQLEMTLTITIKDSSSKDVLSCVTTNVHTGAKEMDNRHILNADASFIEFMFHEWLAEFHSLAHNLGFDYTPKHMNIMQLNNEYLKRRAIFAENFLNIVKHNLAFKQGKETYTRAMNQFGHLTSEEFAKTFLNGILPKPSANKKNQDSKKSFVSRIYDSVSVIIPSETFYSSSKKTKKQQHIRNSNDDLPEEVDWVAKGAVAPVKNQGSCGSCWAFSAISALESAYFLKYGELKTFSEQELVSCEKDTYGCGGGLMDLAFAWIQQNGGICSSAEYPYVSGTGGMNGFCKSTKCTPDPRSAIKSFVDVDHTEDALKAAVAERPVSVAIEADQYAFQFYSTGVLTAECGDKLDHGVVVVGYGVYQGTTPYWKVRNSWGANWGMQGYILIERGKQVPDGDGECGIVADPSYPVL